MANKDLLKQETLQSFEDDSNDIPPIDIVAFNELRSCADLLRLYLTDQLEIQPDFQREVVWSKPEQTRFIDSLTKQLPIPSMCISVDYNNARRIIIDGLQRMTSIINFLSDNTWKLSELPDIDSRLSGKTVEEIKERHKDIYERVENVMIPITVIRCDYNKKSHNEYLFTIFHRLNSGGVKLNNQEIRNCIYNGTLNTLLKRLGKSQKTKKLFGSKSRFANEEMILRFFAFRESVDDYNGRLSSFLNSYMFNNRIIKDTYIQELENTYNRTITIVYEKIFNNQQAKSYSKTLLEGLMYGVSKNLEKLEKLNKSEIKKIFQEFILLDEFSQDNLKEGLSAKDKVIARLKASEKCFKGL